MGQRAQSRVKGARSAPRVRIATSSATMQAAVDAASADPNAIYTIEIHAPVGAISWTDDGYPLSTTGNPVRNVNMAFPCLPISPKFGRYQLQCPAGTPLLAVRRDDARIGDFYPWAELAGKTTLEYSANAGILTTMAYQSQYFDAPNGAYLSDGQVYRKTWGCYACEPAAHSKTHTEEPQPLTEDWLKAELDDCKAKLEALSDTVPTHSNVVPRGCGVTIKGLCGVGNWAHELNILNKPQGWSLPARRIRNQFSWAMSYTGEFHTKATYFGQSTLGISHVAGLTSGALTISGDTVLMFHGVAGAWVDGTTYTAGLTVADGANFYTCKTNHTAVAATNRPGSGSGWAASWTLEGAILNNIYWITATAYKALIDKLATYVADGSIYPVTLTGYYLGDKLAGGVAAAGDEPLARIDFNNFAATPTGKFASVTVEGTSAIASYNDGGGARNVFQIPNGSGIRVNFDLPTDRAYRVVVHCAKATATAAAIKVYNLSRFRTAPPNQVVADAFTSDGFAATNDWNSYLSLAAETINSSAYVQADCCIGVHTWCTDGTSLRITNAAAGDLVIKMVDIYAA